MVLGNIADVLLLDKRYHVKAMTQLQQILTRLIIKEDREDVRKGKRITRCRLTRKVIVIVRHDSTFA